MKVGDQVFNGRALSPIPALRGISSEIWRKIATGSPFHCTPLTRPLSVTVIGPHLRPPIDTKRLLLPMYTKREILKQERILSILQRRDLHETKSLVPQCMQSTSDLRNNHSDANEALTLLDSRLIAWPSLDCSFAQWSDAPTQLYFEHNVTLPTWNSGGFRLAQTRTMHAASVLFDPLVSAHGETISAPQNTCLFAPVFSTRISALRYWQSLYKATSTTTACGLRKHCEYILLCYTKS
jgi:hypothetical protein